MNPPDTHPPADGSPTNLNPLAGFVTAWRTLTVLRMPGRETGSFAHALPWFPLVGGLLGLLVAAAAWAAAAGAHWPALAGVAGAGLLALVTGGLHLDGLADGADGLYGERTAERRLEIMKDPRVGAMGVAAIVFVVLLKTIAIARLAELGAWLWLALPMVWSRTAMAVLAASLPYARAEGTARGFIAASRPAHAAAAVLVALAITLPLAPGPALGCAAAAALLSLLLRRAFLRAVNGITGDLLGFSCEFSETVLLLGLALAKGCAP
jgi:adenosylcobinamide-GDP ribazoletransferase